MLMAAEISSQLPASSYPVATPLGACLGEKIQERIVLIVILRAGLALLPSFMQLFPSAPIGFLGIRRDEKTFLPHAYYENIPTPSGNDCVFLLDPMLATGGTAVYALNRLKEMNFEISRTHLVSILAAQSGIQAVKEAFSEINIYSVAVDEKLNSKKYIVPGLGDFGDRYFME